MIFAVMSAMYAIARGRLEPKNKNQSHELNPALLISETILFLPLKMLTL